MGRKSKLDQEQIDQIRDIYSSRKASVKELAASYGVSVLLVYRVINRQGAYRDNPIILGSPILNAHGEVINIETPRQG